MVQRPRTHIPKPFQRPGITLGDTGAKKHWVEAPAELIRPGDIIRGAGLVEDIVMHDFAGFLAKTMKPYLEFSMKSGDTLVADVGSTLIAFTEAEGTPVG